MLCATRPWKVCDVRDLCWRLEVVLSALEMLEGMRRVLLCMPEVVEGDLCLLELLEVLNVMRCVLFCILEGVEGRIHLLDVLEVLGVMRHVRLCMLEGVEGGSLCERCWRCRR